MSTPLITQTITPLPPAPDPATDDAPTFSSKASAMVLGQKAMVPEMNIYAGQANALASGVDAAAAAADADAAAAAASALDAAQASGVSAWVSGTAYTTGQQRYSLINFRTYRRTTNGGGTTDPANDPANWAPPVQLGLLGYLVSDNPAVPVQWTCPVGVKLVEYEIQNPGWSSATSTTAAAPGGAGGDGGKGSFEPTEGVTYTLAAGQPATPGGAGTNTSSAAGANSSISGTGLTTITPANARVQIPGGAFIPSLGFRGVSMLSTFAGSGPGAGAMPVGQNVAGAAGRAGLVILRY